MQTELLLLAHKMLGLGTLIAATGGVLAVVDFTDKITLGSILTTFAIVAVAGIFTIRSKIATIWREEAEGERSAKERLQEELSEEKADRADFERQQQELRHDLKDQISGLRAQLKVMEAKTDLTSALDAIKQMNETAVGVISHAVTDVLERTSKLSEQRDKQTHQILGEIRDKLPSEPINVVEIGGDAPRTE